jgi:hypothetical protein
MSNEEQLKIFRDYTRYAKFDYNDNGPDLWVCPVCDYSQDVIYIAPGVKEAVPMTKDLVCHACDCPWNEDNLTA